MEGNNGNLNNGHKSMANKKIEINNITSQLTENQAQEALLLVPTLLEKLAQKAPNAAMKVAEEINVALVNGAHSGNSNSVSLEETNGNINNSLLTGAVVKAEAAGKNALNAVNQFEENPTSKNAKNVVKAVNNAAFAANRVSEVSGNPNAEKNAVKTANSAENANLALAQGNSEKLVNAGIAAGNAALNTAAAVKGMQGGAPKKKSAPKKKAAPKKKPSKK